MASTNKCTYCGKEFAKARTLQVHLCEPKRRYLQRDEKWVVNAFMVFQRFYQIHQHNSKPKTYDDFVKSSYYNAFVKFGSFLSNVKPLYPERFIDYVVTSGVKLDHWCREELYQTYALDVILKERVEDAVKRSVKNMMEWSDEKGAPWNHYFKYASLNRATQEIKDGKISPWLVLNCASGKAMLKNMNEEQLQIVSYVLNPQHWSLRFKRSPADVEIVKEIVREAGL